MALVVKAFACRLPDGAVHSLDLTVGPGMVGLSKPVVNVIGFADHVKAHLTRLGGVAVAQLLGELDAVVCQDRVNALGHGFQQKFEELPSRPPLSPVDELGDRESTRAVDADEQVKLTFGRLHLGNIDVKEADRVALEALRLGRRPRCPADEICHAAQALVQG